MAKGKKGVKNYLLILLLAIIATFLILVTVMLFQPFKNILGFQYFIYNDDVIVSHATGASEGDYFDFSSVDNINIDCGYANVKVERSYKTSNYSFRFENQLSGFAKDDQNTDFRYEIFYANGNKTLNVKVYEPEGFLYFNRNLTISILVPTEVENSLENTEININNKSGNIYIGNNTKQVNFIEEDYRNYISIKTINAKTNSGNICVLSYLKSNIENLFLNTGSGRIQASIDLNVSGSCEIFSSSGEIDFKSLKVGLIGKLDLGNSKFRATKLEGSIQINIKQGYFDVDIFQGILSSNEAITQMNSATLNIGEFSGDLSLPYANKSRINLGKILGTTSQIYIQATEGSVNIREMYGNVAKIVTTSGNVNINTKGNDVDIETTSGNIDITYDSNTIDNQIDILSSTGKINFKFKPDFAFNLEVFNSKGEARTDKNVKVEGFDQITENPTVINGGGKVVKLTTNSLINVGII